MTDIPAGFTRLSFNSAYLGHIGPFHEGRRDGERIVALRLDERHMNNRDIAHGGVVSTLADVTLSFALVTADPAVQGISTVSLNTEFLGTGRLGDWLEAEAQIDRMGGSLAFAHGRITVGGTPVATMSGVFKLYRRTAS
ncbi:MAG: hotdog fold thioesterase [Alphaproteobacteria bacterium]|nr:hotdog fold thioesterase [Alphaproteobacteria bacterium]